MKVLFPKKNVMKGALMRVGALLLKTTCSTLSPMINLTFNLRNKLFCKVGIKIYIAAIDLLKEAGALMRIGTLLSKTGFSTLLLAVKQYRIHS